MTKMVTIIGRGRSGTRAISETLSRSGVYMGRQLNNSGDLVPPYELYAACRIMSAYVRYIRGARWDFSRLQGMAIDQTFTTHVKTYLADVLESEAPLKGWKLPETTLIYPWIIRMFPDAKYIYWIRDPRDCILRKHLTDRLCLFSIPSENVKNTRLRRAISWKYQADIVKYTPRPKHFLTVRFEDFVLNQDVTIAKIESFLGFSLTKIPINPEAVGRWKLDQDQTDFEFLHGRMEEHGYL